MENFRRVSADTTSPADLDHLAGLYAVGRADEALSAWRILVDSDPAVLSRIDHLYWFCLTLLETERAGESATLLEDARGSGLLDSDRSYLHAMTKELLCAAYLELGEFDRAAMLAAEIARHGVVPEARILALYDLARAREGAGDPDGAREVWEILASTEGSTPEAVYARKHRTAGAARSPTHPASVSEARGDGFCLHVGSSRDHVAAAAWAAAARAAGLSASIREDQTPEGMVFTVHSQPLPSLQEAAEAQTRVAAVGLTHVVIVSSTTVETSGKQPAVRR